MPQKQEKKKLLTKRQVKRLDNLIRIVRERVGQVEGACGFFFDKEGYICIQHLGAVQDANLPLEIAGIPVVGMPIPRRYIQAVISIRRSS